MRKRVMVTLFWAMIGALVGSALVLSVLAVVQDRRIDDLEQRVTMQETVRIEAVAPPEGESP